MKKYIEITFQSNIPWSFTKRFWKPTRLCVGAIIYKWLWWKIRFKFLEGE